ncbi:MAG: hypothetical protein M2R46_04410 [Verrucomicrobia subdivision 3 bacterium]|nr:hypothetical protein [Limisphaerales bacterium]
MERRIPLPDKDSATRATTPSAPFYSSNDRSFTGASASSRRGASSGTLGAAPFARFAAHVSFVGLGDALQDGPASPDMEARMRRCKRRAAGCISPRSRANWWRDKLFLALIGMPIAMNYFWSGTLVFLKRVPAKTLKPDWQTWQGQRPIRRLSALRAALPLPQWGQ